MVVSNWQEQDEDVQAPAAAAGSGPESISSADPELEAFRRQLEGLL
jgi:hypothetical protein